MAWRTLLASLLVLLAGTGSLALATDGFRAYTTEGARRLAVERKPPQLPDAQLQAAGGEETSFASLRGRWLLVDFIYTRCMSYCAVQGQGFARLQRELAPQLAAGSVELLSLSFDPRRDGPAELAAYQRRLGGVAGKGWLVARPADAAALAAVMQAFGVVALDDGFGGFVHNAAINVVDPSGRLVAVLDPDALDEARDFVLGRLAP